MGVPSFYRWLVNKYPKIVSDAGDHNTTMELDNFYLDMNGIIHPCFHPEDTIFPPTTFEEVFSSMYEYIDHLFHIVKPRKLLFMAIDGVAPRAKMNQQRARRFRAAKDTEMTDEMEEQLRKEFAMEGKVVLPKEESEICDSNVITPGTEFMQMLSNKLRSYVSQRMREDPAWSDIKVILSDDKVPGEGEHKIMSFIRAQRALPGYDPNTSHCLYGLDADLIMLALATHELHFCILREEVLSTNKENSCHTIETCSLKSREWFKEKSSAESATETEMLASCKEAPWRANRKQVYQFLNVCILREYLALDLNIHSSDNKLECDFERVVDDYIFICFFAGNDFLPHMPTLEIHEGCIDLLMHVYKSEFQNLGGHLVDMQNIDDKKGGYIKLKRVERFILAVGAYEDEIFAKRSQLKERRLRRILADYREAKDYEKNQLEEGTSSDIVGLNTIARVDGLKISTSDVDADTVLNNTKELKQKLKENTRKQSDLFKDGAIGTDKVKLGSPGWKQRYYKVNFSAESTEEMEATRKAVVAKYSEGLCWVLLYYFSGVPSWTWFYPFHYGPFASDMNGLSQTKVKFQKGVPFKPFDQLMGVLPPRSSHALPVSYKGLMIDENSSIIGFYPTDFETDVDGKRFMWQGICKLPFIEEERLLTETSKLENGLKDHEKTRNTETLDQFFVRCSSEMGQQLLCNGVRSTSERIKGAVMMESPMEGIKGTIHLMPEDLTRVVDDLCVFYEIPRDSKHVPGLLEGVNIPEKMVNEEDIVDTILWHERRGYTNSSNMFQNGRMMKPNFESRAQNPAPEFIYKGFGVGFLGRGKTSLIMARESSTSSPYCSHGGRDFQPASARKPSYNVRSGRGSLNTDGYGVYNAYRSSGPISYYRSNIRPNHQTSNEFWQPRSGVPNHQTRNEFRQPRGGVPNHQTSNEFRQPHCGVPNHQTSNKFWQPRSGVPNHQTSNEFRQPCSGVPNHPTSNEFRQPRSGVPNHPTSNEFRQPRSGVPNHKTSNEFRQPCSGVPNHQSSNEFLQPRSGVARGEVWRGNKPFLGNSGRGRGRGRGWYSDS